MPYTPATWDLSLRRLERRSNLLLTATATLGLLITVTGVCLAGAFTYGGLTGAGASPLIAGTFTALTVLFALLTMMALAILSTAMVDVWWSVLPLQSRHAIKVVRTTLSTKGPIMPWLVDLSPVARFTRHIVSEVSNVDNASYGHHRRTAFRLADLVGTWSDRLEQSMADITLSDLLVFLRDNRHRYTPPEAYGYHYTPAVVASPFPRSLRPGHADGVVPDPDTEVLFCIAGTHPTECRPCVEYDPVQLALRTILRRTCHPFTKHPTLRACIAPRWVYELLHRDSMHFTRSSYLTLPAVGQCFILDVPHDVRTLLVGLWNAPYGFDRAVAAAVKLDAVSRHRRLTVSDFSSGAIATQAG